MTTDLVMAEIRDATADGTRCWASQPGMIRSWDATGSAAGAKYYKLYSDSVLIGNGAFDHTVCLVPDGSHSVNGSSVAWYNQQGVYVDLNQPVSVNGVNQYPIVDGNTADYSSVTFSTVSNSTTPMPAIIKPIPTTNVNTVKVLGGSMVTTGLPNGFWLNSLTPAQSTTANQAPMPVMWLYVLKDGDLAVPDVDTSASTTVTFANSSIKPSQANPIVGRIAYWTDDETCKVNVNTASEGTYWDIPRANSNNSPFGDTNLSKYAPAQFEFQRYPGHPAMTSLSTIFNVSSSEPIYSITPRTGPGGSVGGTIQTTQGKAFTAVTPNSNRLYASPDEFVFQPTLSGTARLQNTALGVPGITPASLKQARFFITTNSRAPDVNLFNQPRIEIWPIAGGIHTAAAYFSPFDRLIAFCGQIGKNTGNNNPYLYYFQRQDPTDNLVDLPVAASPTGLGRNRMLMSYLRYFLGQNVPGFGANFAAKYNTANPTLAGTDCDQILTEIFDYIRSTNLRDPSVITPYTYKFDTSWNGGIGQVIPIEDSPTATRGFGRFRTLQGGSLLFIANADGDQAGSQPSPVSNHVAPGYMRIQAIFLPQFFDPSPGSVFDNPCFNYSVSGLNNFQVGTVSGTVSGSGITNFGFTPSGTYTSIQSYYALDNAYWGDQYGIRQVATSGLISASVDVLKTTGTFTFVGGPVTVTIQTPIGTTGGTSATVQGKVLQTIQLNFPNGSFPIPSLAPSGAYNYASYGSSAVTSGPFNMRYFNSPPALQTPNTASGSEFPCINTPSAGGRLQTANQTATGAWITSYDVIRSVSTPGDIRLIAAQKNVPDSSSAKYPYAPVGSYSSSSLGAIPANGTSGLHTFFDGQGEPYPGAMYGKLIAAGNYDISNYYPANNSYNTMQYFNAGSSTGGGGTVQANEPGGYGGLISCYNFQDVFNPTTGAWLNGVTMGSYNAFTGSAGQVLGDWDNGVGYLRDGPFINKADEGDTGNSGNPPYNWKGRTGNYNLTTGLFTPNRMIPSAVMFGSLPTGVFANKPWQTLLFRPGPIGHTGLGTSTTPIVPISQGGTDQGAPYSIVPDHLILDLFTMPVVEPYAISEPLSTAGRINMNTLIVPFNYINRDTGLRAVLKAEQVVTIPDSLNTYKIGWATYPTPIRASVNVDATLAQFYDRRFNNKDIFRSPSEICDIDIVPTGAVPGATSPSRLTMDNYWNGTGSATAPVNGHRLTGDNSRERIYATLYPRLTTKSNTFTVHFRVQTLKPALGPNADATAWQSWREGTDVVTSEYRGSQTIERYVDPNDPSLPDFASNPSTTQTLAPYYRFRVLSTKQFAP